MNNLDLSAYKSLYLKTAREHLANLKKNLDLLTQNPADKTAVYEVFRLFHSLKSQNFFMGYQKTALLCKLLEDFFRNINDGKKNFKTNESGIVAEIISKLENSLNQIETNNSEVDLGNDIINFENKIATL